MFENFERAKTQKRMTWATILLTVSVAGHAIAFTGLAIHSFWVIRKLEPPKRDQTIAIAPPPPPPPLKGGKKMNDAPKEIKPKKRKVTDAVQPVKIEPKVEQDTGTTDDSNLPEGDPDGDVNGDPNGVAGGVVTEAPPPPPPPAPPPPPPPPAPPQIVAPNVLQGNRISGDAQIVPDDVTKTEIQRSGKNRLITSAKLCLNKDGGVSSVSLIKSSGFPAYDDKIRREMNSWRYRPYTVNGTAVPVCTSITFIYQQR